METAPMLGKSWKLSHKSHVEGEEAGTNYTEKSVKQKNEGGEDF